MCRIKNRGGWRRWRLLAPRRAERGVTALEFAMIAPVAFLLFIGTIETALLLFAQNVLESATYNASRTGKTGYVETNATRTQTILDAIEARAGSFLDMNKIDLSTKSYVNFSSIGQPEPFTDANNNGVRDDGENFVDVNGNGTYDTDRGADTAGNAQQVVIYTITYPWEVHTPFMRQLIGDADGIVHLSSRIVVRNEPY